MGKSPHRDAPYWVHSDPTANAAIAHMAKPCVRGCVKARAHKDDCGDKDCRGCEPRPQGFGLLCFICHKRLADMLHTAGAQHSLLLAVISPSFEQDLMQESTVHVPGPRLSSSAPFYMQLAARTPVSEGSVPLRLAAIDTAAQLSDVLSGWVEMLADQHSMHGPNRLQTAADIQAGASGHWRVSRWSLYVEWCDLGTREVFLEDPEWVWSEPPAEFEVRSAAKWLLAQLALLETCPGIGDLWTELAELMSQAHAVAPWREQAATLAGIECPECHKLTLKLFGGEEDVTCTTCHAIIKWNRYAIWVRQLQQRRAEAS